jgi:hypothetical protein
MSTTKSKLPPLLKAGGLWAKKNKDGGTYYSGKIEIDILPGTSIMVFPNTYKTQEKQPDFKMFVSSIDKYTVSDKPPNLTTSSMANNFGSSSVISEDDVPW